MNSRDAAFSNVRVGCGPVGALNTRHGNERTSGISERGAKYQHRVGHRWLTGLLQSFNKPVTPLLGTRHRSSCWGQSVADKHPPWS